jgi:hypothetical protein
MSPIDELAAAIKFLKLAAEFPTPFELSGLAPALAWVVKN